MEGLDGHFSNGKLQYKIFVAGIGWAPGLILRKAPISGSSTTRILFLLFSYDNAIFISSCISCKYCHIVFASHFLCPKWAAAQQTGAKSKKKMISFCKRSNISVWKVAAQDQAHDFINVYAYEKCYASPVVPSMGCRTTGDGAKSKAQKKVMFS